MNTRARVVAVAAGLGFLEGLVHLLPTVAFQDPVSGMPPWLPQFGTVGQTVVTYLVLTRTVGYIVAPLLVVVAGYWLAGSLDLRAQHREFLKLFGAGAVAGVVLGRAVVVGATLPESPSVGVVAIAVVPAIGAAFEMVLAALAGAALAFFAGEAPPAEPPESTSSPPDATTGD